MTDNLCFDGVDTDLDLFNSDLEKWLDSFEEEMDGTDLQVSRQGNIENENNAQNINKGEEYSSELTLPATRIFSNDIRHNFARMFMNTFNSGDFMHVQNFLRSYMTQSCKMIAQHYIRDGALNYPSLIVTIGPRQFSHHLMGQFTQYPDTIMTMSDCRVITHPNWLGAKVVIDITTSSTKMCSLAMEDWVPPLDKMSKKYEEATKVNEIPLKPTTTTAATAVPATTKCVDIDSTADLSDLSLESEEERALRSSTTKKRQQKKKQKAVFSRAKHARTIAQGGGGIQPGGKQQRTRLNKDLTSSGINLPCSDQLVAEILKRIDSKTPYIPENYGRLLMNKAKPVSGSLKLVTRGRMTFYLNEANQLQHMNCEVGQTNYK